MKKGFIATVLAIALAITGVSTVQARADTEDVIGVLLGLAIVAGVASALDDDDKRVDRHRDGYYSNNDRYAHRYDYRERDHRYRSRVRAALRNCEREFRTRRGTQLGYGQRCLERRLNRVDLPDRCLREGRINHRWRSFYAKRCLHNEGLHRQGQLRARRN